MKKIIFFVALFCSCGIFANNITPKTDKNLRKPQLSMFLAPDCKIIKKNTLKYCLDHGFTKKEAEDIATAAFDQCEKVK